MKVFFPIVLVAALLGGCGEPAKVVQPKEVAEGTACSLDGMVLNDFPGPKGQIVYDQGEPDFFCDTKELFSIYLRPEQKRHIVGVFTQDMGKTAWAHPQGNWIDAKSAFFVVGSKREGSMGPTIGAFGREPDANAFAAQFGGKVLRFEQVTLDMVDLSGGVVHDGKM